MFNIQVRQRDDESLCSRDMGERDEFLCHPVANAGPLIVTLRAQGWNSRQQRALARGILPVPFRGGRLSTALRFDRLPGLATEAAFPATLTLQVDSTWELGAALPAAANEQCGTPRSESVLEAVLLDGRATPRSVGLLAQLLVARGAEPG